MKSSPFLKLGCIVLHLSTAESTPQTESSSRLLAGSPRFTPNTGPQWVDYPAYALNMPPGAAVYGGTGFGVGPTNGGKKKKEIQMPPPPILHQPIFDIMVEPEYIPDPFPVPYPYPIEVQPQHGPPGVYQESPGPIKPKYKRQQYIERSQAEWVCPRDYIQEGNSCVMVDQVEVQIGCPDGWRHEDGVCRTMDSQVPESVCDDGFRPWENKAECVRELYAPKEMLCPEGHMGFSGGCKKHVESPAVASCMDAKLSQNMCLRQTKARPNEICPPGFVPTQERQWCFREHNVLGILTCPSQAYQINAHGMCEMQTTKHPQHTCPGGFTIVGQECVKETIDIPTSICQKGQKDPAGLCTIIEGGPPAELICEHPAALQLSKRMCETIVEHPPEKTCPSAHSLDPITETCTAKATSKKKSGLIPAVPAVLQCPHGMTLNEKHNLCIGIVSNIPTMVCPSPYNLEHFECTRSVQAPPSLICPPHASLIENQCIHRQAVPPTAFCPAGFTLNGVGLCELFESIPAKTSCPVGYESIMGGMECQKLEKIEAYLECPPMMDLHHDHLTKSAICLGEEILEPLFSCGVDGMTLEFTVEGPICRGIQLQAATFTCPATYNDAGGKCTKYESSPKRAICPEGYKFSFNICLKEVEQPSILLCPEGFTYYQLGESCMRKRRTDLMPVCAGDMKFDRLVGECYSMKVQYDFEEGPPPIEAMKDLGSPTPPEEALKDLSSPIPPPPIDIQPPMMFELPPPQLTIVQQPVVIPQPAVILPQQAPVPPPPVIRVPYGVPQPVPTAVEPKHKHNHYHYQTDLILPQEAKPAGPPIMSGKKKFA